MNNEWREVKEVTPEMVGWEAKGKGGFYYGIITAVGKMFALIYANNSGETTFPRNNWLVRPPAPKKRTIRQQIEEKFGMPIERIRISTDIFELLVDILDEREAEKS